MRVLSLALVSFGLTFAACGNKDKAPEAAAANGAAPAEGEKAADNGKPTVVAASAVTAPVADFAVADKPAEAVVEAEIAGDPEADELEAGEPATDDGAVAGLVDGEEELQAVASPTIGEVGIASCDKYIRAAQGCLDKAPLESRAKQQQAFAAVIDAWRAQLASQGDAVRGALDLGCTQAFETAKTAWSGMCPDFVW